MAGEGTIPMRRPLIEAPLEFRLMAGSSNRDPARALLLCPKCDAPAFIRRSDRLTQLVKHLTAHCTNSGCGHIFEAEIVATRTLVPGLIERPDLNLPVAPRETVAHVLPPSRDGPDPDQPGFFDPP